MNRISHLTTFNNTSFWSQGVSDIRKKLDKLKNRCVLITYQSNKDKKERKIADILDAHHVMSFSSYDSNQYYLIFKLSLKKAGNLYFIDGEESDLETNKNVLGLIKSVKLDLS